MKSISNGNNKYKLQQIVADIKRYRDEPLLEVVKLAKLKGVTNEEIAQAMKETVRSVYRLTNKK